MWISYTYNTYKMLLFLFSPNLAEIEQSMAQSFGVGVFSEVMRMFSDYKRMLAAQYERTYTVINQASFM